MSARPLQRWAVQRLAAISLAAIAFLGLIFSWPVSRGTAADGDAPSGKRPAQAVKDVLSPADPAQVRLEGFLGHRMAVNRKALLADDESRLLQPFRSRVLGKSKDKGSYDGEFLAKWICGASHAVRNAPEDKLLREKLDRIVKELIKTQEADGYLGTVSPRFAGWDVWVHQFLLLALLDNHEWTGDRASFDAARKIGDLLAIACTDQSDSPLYKGQIEPLCIQEPIARLYQQTANEKLRELCLRVALAQERRFKMLSREDFIFKPFEGLCCYMGLCELYRATGEKRYLDAAIRMWSHIHRHALYPTGAVTGGGEALSKPDSWPIDGTCEGCVLVTWLQFNSQLLRLTGEARFADEIHRLTYNHLLAAQDWTGNWSHTTGMEKGDGGSSVFQCCSSSGRRAPGLLPTLAYMQGDGVIAVNLYEAGRFKTVLPGGSNLVLTQKTAYPHGEDVELHFELSRPADFELWLLIPFFFSGGSLTVNGKDADVPLKSGTFASIKRQWTSGDRVALRLNMPLEAFRFKGYPGKIAFRVGPQFLVHFSRFPDVGRPKPEWKSPAYEWIPPPFPKFEKSPGDAWAGWEGTRFVRALVATRPEATSKMWMLAPFSEVHSLRFLGWNRGDKSVVTMWHPLD